MNASGNLMGPRPGVRRDGFLDGGVAQERPRFLASDTHPIRRWRQRLIFSVVVAGLVPATPRVERSARTNGVAGTSPAATPPEHFWRENRLLHLGRRYLGRRSEFLPSIWRSIYLAGRGRFTVAVRPLRALFSCKTRSAWPNLAGRERPWRAAAITTSGAPIATHNRQQYAHDAASGRAISSSGHRRDRCALLSDRHRPGLLPGMPALGLLRSCGARSGHARRSRGRWF
jgi:hypothetical protein